MLKFSHDGATADRQMRAVIFYLTTFGYIDGDFDHAEKAFVRTYIERLVKERVDGAVDASDVVLRGELQSKYTAHFHEVFENTDQQVRDLFTEAVADGEDHNQFVHAKLKLRCFEIFKSFDAANQELLMDCIDELIRADGQLHPAELKFRGELADLLEDELGVELLEDDSPRARVAVSGPASVQLPDQDDPALNALEEHYSVNPGELSAQLERDRELVQKTMATLEEQRFRGAGKLGRAQSVDEFAGGEPFLDSHVHVFPAKPGVSYDVTVLGDLHGCYSCLKAAVMQSRFLEKVERHRRDPGSVPYPMFVLLGDYIDRGIFSYHGVLRAAMQLYTSAPEHVFMLRGNHEFYFQHKGQVYGGVKPAEAINSLKPHVPNQAVFERYMAMFDMLPNVLLFDKFLFVHAGIPRDSLFKERYTDLSSLNDSDLRFQMMWSDPSSADVIPASLQEQSARFPFGRLQCQAFLQRIGCHTLIRGHEKVEEGFRRIYDDEHQLLISLFSAGGKSNGDLPETSSYRAVVPKALTLRLQDGVADISPWELRYEAFNDPNRNAFFRQQPQMAHLVG